MEKKEFLKKRAYELAISPTKAETILLSRLIEKRIPHEFQKVIGDYIVDFVIGKHIIELDGSSHDGKEIADAIRTKVLIKKGFTVIRIPNHQAKSYPLKELFDYVIRDKDHTSTTSFSGIVIEERKPYKQCKKEKYGKRNKKGKKSKNRMMK